MVLFLNLENGGKTISVYHVGLGQQIVGTNRKNYYFINKKRTDNET